MIAAPFSGTFSAPSWIGRKILVIAGPSKTFFNVQYTARPAPEPDSIATLPSPSTETRSSLRACRREGRSTAGPLLTRSRAHV
jgi:hypothetical protein